MSKGHEHRHVTVPSFDRWYVRLLRKPVRHCTNMRKVIPSPYPYGPCPGPCPHDWMLPKPDCWVLTPLGILHRWTGLTLQTEDDD